MPHRKAGRVGSEDEVGFEDCQEDGSVGNEQADSRDDEEGTQGQEEALLEGEGHGLEDLCLHHLPLARSGIMTKVINAKEVFITQVCVMRSDNERPITSMGQ